MKGWTKKTYIMLTFYELFNMINTLRSCILLFSSPMSTMRPPLFSIPLLALSKNMEYVVSKDGVSDKEFT